MSTSVSVNESPSLQDRTRTPGKGGARAAIGLLIAVNFVWLAMGRSVSTRSPVWSLEMTSGSFSPRKRCEL